MDYANYAVMTAEEVTAMGEGYITFESHPVHVVVSHANTCDTFGVQEVQIYIHQLVRKNGKPPEGMTLFVQRIDSQWGSYLKAAVRCKVVTNEIDRYSRKLEKGVARWDKQSLASLRALGHPYYTGSKKKK